MHPQVGDAAKGLLGEEGVAAGNLKEKLGEPENGEKKETRCARKREKMDLWKVLREGYRFKLSFGEWFQSISGA